MTRETFLAASGLDKLAEMDSAIASPQGTSESPLAPGSSGYHHICFQYTALWIHVALQCFHNERTDNVQMGIQLLAAIIRFSAIKTVDLS